MSTDEVWAVSGPDQGLESPVRMPRPVCVRCGTEETLLWRTVDSGQVCYDCHGSREETEKQPEVKKEVKSEETSAETEDRGSGETKSESGDVTPARATGKGIRKSTRSTRYKSKTPSTVVKTLTARGRGRRSIFKRQPLKAPASTSTIVTSDCIFYKGNYLQLGDIVSMVDVSGDTYYAQLRGFMTDQYCEKSAVVTWLLPTKASPPPHLRFDPATYIIGPEEELPRKLDVMEFVMHAPSDYYRSSTAPYPLHDHSAPFIWSSLEPVDRQCQTQEVA